MSGYDIKKFIEIALSHFWHESYGQLFPTLNRLVDEGLARKKSDPKSGNRPRYVYTITAKGRRAFEAWLREPSESPKVRNEIQLKFFLTSRSEPKESRRLLTEYRDQQSDQLEEYRLSETILARAVRDGTPPEEVVEILGEESPSNAHEFLIFYLTLRHGILAIEARLEWIDESLRALSGSSIPHPRR